MLLIAIFFVATGCIFDDEDDPPLLTLSLRPPPSSIPPIDGKSPASVLASYPRRCIIDVFKEGSTERVIRKEYTSGDILETDIELDAGCYDIMVWCDCLLDGHAARNPCYDPYNLHTITLLTENYIANTDGKDASCVRANSVEIGCGHTVLELPLERPLAKYRMIADDVAAYSRLRSSHPDDYPPIDELIFNVFYEFFLPVSFNVATGRPNDSATGISYSGKIRRPDGFPVDDDAMIIGEDMIFATDERSVVTLTLEVTDTTGRLYGRATGISIEYRRGYVTTVRGNFLTLGASAGGITIDTDWRDDILIYF